MNLLKSTAAIFTGILAIVLLSTGTDLALENLDVFPPIDQAQMMPWMLALAFLYRTIYGMVGGYLTAALAPGFPLRHAVILGIIGTMASIAGAMVGWHLSDHWYPIALVVTAPPTTWLGGEMRIRKSIIITDK